MPAVLGMWKRRSCNWRQTRPDRMVIDLSAVSFIDSTGLAFLVEALRRAEQKSQRLQVVPSKSKEVQRLFRLCGLEGLVPFTEAHEPSGT